MYHIHILFAFVWLLTMDENYTRCSTSDTLTKIDSFDSKKEQSGSVILTFYAGTLERTISFFHTYIYTHKITLRIWYYEAYEDKNFQIFNIYYLAM